MPGAPWKRALCSICAPNITHIAHRAGHKFRSSARSHKNYVYFIIMLRLWFRLFFPPPSAECVLCANTLHDAVYIRKMDAAMGNAKMIRTAPIRSSETALAAQQSV
jgi:hypothetical protein